MGDAARLAIGTLTVLRVPPPRRVDRGVAGRAMLLAPLTTLPVLALAGLWAWAVLALTAPPLLGAAVALAALALSSRGLHLDGLADTVDALSASYDRERSLAVMRRGDVGPGGVASLALVLLADGAALGALFRDWTGLVLAATAVLASRLTLAWACCRGVPAARPDGLGATVAGSVPMRLAGCVAAGSALASGAASWAVGAAWWRGPVVVAAALLAGGVVIRRAVARFGGITGDVLGATVEVSFAGSLVVAALLHG